MVFIRWVEKESRLRILAVTAAILHGRRRSAWSEATKKVSVVSRDKWEMCTDELCFLG